MIIQITLITCINIPMISNRAVEQPWLFWGTERIENRYYSRPQILDFHIPLYLATILMATVQQWWKEIHRLAKTYRWVITWLWSHHDYFWWIRRSEVYNSGPHIVDLNFLPRSSIHSHKNWSTVMQIAHKFWKYIPDWLPGRGASLTIPEYKEEVGCAIRAPDYICHQCTAN